MSKRTKMLDKLVNDFYDRVSDNRCAIPIKNKEIIKNCFQALCHHLDSIWLEDIVANPQETVYKHNFIKGAYRVFDLIHTGADYCISSNQCDFMGTKNKHKKVA